MHKGLIFKYKYKDARWSLHIIYNCLKTLTQSIRVSWRANRLSGISIKSENWLLMAAPPLPTASEAGEA